MVSEILSKYKNNVIVSRFIKVFSVDALVKASALVFLPVYLKLMTQEEYATFSYVSSIISTFGLVFNFGLYIPQCKIYHDLDKRQKGVLLYTINILLLALFVILFFPLYIFDFDYVVVRFLFSHSVNYSVYRYLILIGIIISVYSCMLFYFFMTEERISRVQIYNILRLILGAGFAFGALFWIPGDKADIRLKTFLFVEILLLVSFSYSYLRTMRPSFDWALAVKSLNLGMPVMISAVLGVIINFGDKFFIEKYCSLEDLSIYYLAFTCASVVPTVFMSLQNIWLPIFLKEKDLKINLVKTKKIILTVSVMFGILAFIVWIGAFSALFFDIFDDIYYPILNILPVLLISRIISSLCGLLSNYTVYWNMTYVTIISGVSVAFISVPLNIYGVKSYGVYGIVAADLVINAIYFIFYFLFVNLKVKSLCRV